MGSIKIQSLFVSSSLALVAEIILQFVVGILLSTQYHSGAGAYHSVLQIRSSHFGALLSGLHYWGSSLLILHSLLQITALIFTSGYLKSANIWFGTIITFLGAMVSQITGNALPMDRHGVQTVVVETGLMNSVPFVGAMTRSLALGGTSYTVATNQRWFMFHEVLVIAVLLAGIVFLWKGISRFHEKRPLSMVIAPFLLLLIVAIAVPAPLGNIANPADYSEFNAHVSWYTWPMHGMMQVCSKISPSLNWIGFAVVPGLFIAFLLAIPVLSLKLKPLFSQIVFTLFSAAFMISGFLYGGSIASLTGNRDPSPDAALTNTNNPTNPISKAVATDMISGKNLFNGSLGCSGCHGTNGANGSSGPNLTHEYQKHDSAWIQKYVNNPQSVDSGSTMPAFPQVTSSQLQQLGAYLSHPAK